jgi:glutamate carboxypeptidase
LILPPASHAKEALAHERRSQLSSGDALETGGAAMDVNALPFDAEEMLGGLRRFVECESPTFDAAAVNRVMTLAATPLAGLGAAVDRIAGPQGFGDCVRARLPHRKAGEPGILVMAHLDTVHPVGTLTRMPFRREGGRCFGPGIFDMKGGFYLALEAARQLHRAMVATKLPVTFLLTCDEEIGSPGPRELILAEARRQKYVLVPEPARQNGGFVSGRYAIARYHIEAFGRPSHAGATLKEGRSAVSELARRILEIEAMTSDDCTFSASVLQGGQWVNCVPTYARAEVLSMAKRQADLDHGTRRVLALTTAEGDGAAFQVSVNCVRPVWEPDAGTLALYEAARRIARQIGFDPTHESSGGGSDANFTGAAGVPSLDGLGVRGSGAHTLAEHIEVASLAERGRLMAGLMAELE